MAPCGCSGPSSPRALLLPSSQYCSEVMYIRTEYIVWCSINLMNTFAHFYVLIMLIAMSTTDFDAAPELHQALYYLQHRGQDACGISTCSRGGKVRRPTFGYVKTV